MLSSIDIDTIPYILNSRICGFGIRTHSDGSSRPNPAYSSDFSLFILDGKNLRRIINSYPVSEFHGEWDTNCKGEFEEANSVIIVDNKISNNYHDILIKKTISKIEHYLVKDDCKEKVIKKSFKTVTLKYNGKEYK